VVTTAFGMPPQLAQRAISLLATFMAGDLHGSHKSMIGADNIDAKNHEVVIGDPAQFQCHRPS